MRISPFILLLITTQLFSQSWDQCNVLNLTLDDLNTEYDFSGQGANCGCPSVGNCYLVNFKLVKTINQVVVPVHLRSLTFTSPLTNAEPNHIQKDYVDLYNPSSCREYQSGSLFNHQYSLKAPAPPGENVLLLICPGSESGPMRGRFIADERAPDIAKATNVQATDGESHIDISFNSIPGKYYMVFRSTDICNESWDIVNWSSHWPMATSNHMTIRHQVGGTYGNQYKYRVVSANSPFVIATGASGAWSDPDFGHWGNLIPAYDSNNSCSNVFPVTNCPDHYSGANKLTGIVSTNTDFETNGEIESTQTLGAVGSSNLTIDYDSQISISLLNDFSVKNGIIFRAFIDGCGGSE